MEEIKELTKAITLCMDYKVLELIRQNGDVEFFFVNLNNNCGLYYGKLLNEYLSDLKITKEEMLKFKYKDNLIMERMYYKHYLIYMDFQKQSKYNLGNIDKFANNVHCIDGRLLMIYSLTKK